MALSRPTPLNPTELSVTDNADYSVKYNVGEYSYPDNLGVRPDLQHYVTFFINVRGKSRMDEGNYFTRQERPVNPVGSRLDSESLNQGIYSSFAVKGGLAAAAAGFYGVVSGKPEKGARDAAKIVGITGLALGVLGGGQLASDLLKPDKSYRLKDVITLHMENAPSVGYNATYATPDLGTLTGVLSGGGSSTETTSMFSKLAEGAALAALEISKLPAAVGGQRIGDLIGAAARVKTNPFTEVLFQAVDFRTFNFKYRFFPKNENETIKVQKIIALFKEHMHPTLSSNGFFYIYPSEFEIAYYYKGKENTFLNKISQCALVDMSVEYGGSEQFSSFKNGAPTEIGLSLTFKELELLTRQRVQAGY